MYTFAAMLNFRLAVLYLLHRATSNDRHGLHSPFVYRLVDKVIYDFCAKTAYSELEKVKQQFGNDQRITSLPIKAIQLLYRLVDDRKPATVVMSGLDNPAVLSVLQLAAPQAQFVRNTADSLQQPVKADLIFIEVDSAEQQLTALFEQALLVIHKESVVILNNVHRHSQTRQEWNTIKAHPQVTVTIDLFWFQLVYFREGQAREDFKVRY